MNSIHLFAAGAMLIGATATASPAQAACPGAFSGRACDGGSGGDICWLAQGTTDEIYCDLGISGSDATYNNSTSIHAISPTYITFRAYGYDSDAQAFCCELSGLTNGCTSGYITVQVKGTNDPDRIELRDTATGENLECSNATVYAEDSNDLIYGSDSEDNVDWLFGDDDDDDIYCQDGDDYAYGGTGDDDIWGEGGEDHLYGQEDNDRLKGGPQADYLSGGDNDDVSCGEGGDDTLVGDNMDDELDGGAGTDSATGDSGYDYCSAESMACEALLLGGCPW